MPFNRDSFSAILLMELPRMVVYPKRLVVFEGKERQSHVVFFCLTPTIHLTGEMYIAPLWHLYGRVCQQDGRQHKKTKSRVFLLD